MYSWNTSSQSFTALSGTETISPWIGYWFDATKALTVTFGAASSTDFTSTTYNRLGWVTSTTDQRGVTHNYTYGPNATSGAEQLTLDSAVIPAGSAVEHHRPVDRHRLRQPRPRQHRHQLRWRRGPRKQRCQPGPGRV